MGESKRSLEISIGNLLKNKGYILSIAESCTGGQVSDKITNISGASEYFDRGFITYSNDAKTENLGVPEALINEHGAVSEEVALAMAAGALKFSRADVSISVTGIAGPTGGTIDKPVGTVHIAIAGPTGEVHKKYFFPGDRIRFKALAADAALEMLRRYLED